MKWRDCDFWGDEISNMCLGPYRLLVLPLGRVLIETMVRLILPTLFHELFFLLPWDLKFASSCWGGEAKDWLSSLRVKLEIEKLT